MYLEGLVMKVGYLTDLLNFGFGKCYSTKFVFISSQFLMLFYSRADGKLYEYLQKHQKRPKNEKKYIKIWRNFVFSPFFWLPDSTSITNWTSFKLFEFSKYFFCVTKIPEAKYYILIPNLSLI